MSSLPNKDEKIGFAGLGKLGTPMATQLAKWAKDQGLPPVTVWNRTHSKAEELRKLGCNVAPDLESLARDCDLVITSLANDDVARSVYSSLLSGASDSKSAPGPNGRGHAVVFVETSTLSWTLAGELERQVRKQGHRYLQCPVFGPPPLARESKLVVVMSGDTHARNHAAPYLVPSMGRSTIVGENVESASKLKLLGNSMVLGTVELLAEGMTLADKSGVGAEHLYEFVQSFFPAPSWLGYGKKILDDKFTTDVGFSVDGGLKDSRLIRRLADESSTPVPTIDAAHHHLLAAKANGADEMDWCSLVAGERILAGCHPFKRAHPLDKYYEGAS